MCCPADPPTYDIAGINVDHEGHINEACPCRDIGKVRHPKHVGGRRMELPVHLVERARCGFVADRRAHRLAADDTLQAQVAHKPLYRAPRDGEALAVHLPPDFTHPINTEVLGKDAQHLGFQIPIAPSTIR